MTNMSKPSDYKYDEQRSHQTPAWMIHAALKQKFGENYRFYELVYDREQQRAGVDMIAHLANGTQIRVELKSLRRDPVAKNGCDLLPLETFSHVENQVPGFLLQGHKTSQYVLWIFRDTGRTVMLPFRSLAAAFRRNFREWKATFGTREQETRGYYETYHSECTWVPLILIERAMAHYLRHRYGYIGKRA